MFETLQGGHTNHSRHVLTLVHQYKFFLSLDAQGPCEKQSEKSMLDASWEATTSFLHEVASQITPATQNGRTPPPTEKVRRLKGGVRPSGSSI